MNFYDFDGESNQVKRFNSLIKTMMGLQAKAKYAQIETPQILTCLPIH